MAGDLSHGDAAAFNLLLFFCQTRGEDSTGVFSVKKNTHTGVKYIKAVGTPSDLRALKAYDEVVRPYDATAVIGHCRKATIGVVNKHNAHPFVEGPVIGVHNGSLRHGWDKTLAGEESFHVDSNAIMYALSQVDDPVEVLEKVDGAFALIWYDARTQLLNLSRNKERPLVYCHSKDKRKVFWASERWMLEVALARNGIELDVAEDGNAFWQVPENKLISFSLGDKAKPLNMVRNVEYRPFVYTAPVNHSVYHHNHRGHGVGFHNAARQQQPTPPAKSNVLHLPKPGDSQQPTHSPFVPPQEQQAPPASTSTPKNVSSWEMFQEALKASMPLEPQDLSNSDSSQPSSNVSGLDGSKSFWELLEDIDPVEDDDDTSAFDNEVRGPGGLILGKAQFENIVQDGCQWCQESISFEDEKKGKGVGQWLPEGKFMCVKCKPNNQKMRING